MEPCLRFVCRESLRKVSMKCWTWRTVKCSRSPFRRPLTSTCGRTHFSTPLLRAQGHYLSFRQRGTDVSQAALSSVAPVFVVMKFEPDGSVTSFGELDAFHILLYVNVLQMRLSEVQPQVLDCLESLVDPKLLSADRSKLHMLLLNSKNLSELETDIKVFKDSLLKILDEDELIDELCLTKWSDPQVFEESSLGIDHAEEMELLLENYFMQAEELGNKARELKDLIDDSESVIFINLDSHRNVMMRLNLQLTMGTFSLSLFGLMGVAFGMNLESSFEEDPRVFWLVTGFMFLGSGLIWRRLLSFLGRHLEPSSPPPIPPVWRKNQIGTLKATDIKTWN
ncbi:magnesium transporter MRS2 homolog, mitochondrial-like [Sinocyclocheilus rhinocerous]|uniref:magnesium transporter MRS2 homolog, mitochondrial-like n=1 Tax=Sinocyclocheilus rhinocerous TaxID=307959 RepID=UPI0007B8AE7C|nr:PREDICTED: magnesium transporter MRS2 homolog, mitochondrial-like [Sinocyclocheilus rhinocerous]